MVAYLMWEAMKALRWSGINATVQGASLEQNTLGPGFLLSLALLLPSLIPLSLYIGSWRMGKKPFARLRVGRTNLQKKNDHELELDTSPGAEAAVFALSD